mmetsp:Transcript_19758/g.49144  ORF Transcript_19758/g.49144 Transcript_19758/m.49144 type:complete len:266 (+) Transcript_19758:384-1181(+)
MNLAQKKPTSSPTGSKRWTNSRSSIERGLVSRPALPSFGSGRTSRRGKLSKRYLTLNSFSSGSMVQVENVSVPPTLTSFTAVLRIFLWNDAKSSKALGVLSETSSLGRIPSPLHGGSQITQSNDSWGKAGHTSTFAPRSSNQDAAGVALPWIKPTALSKSSTDCATSRSFGASNRRVFAESARNACKCRTPTPLAASIIRSTFWAALSSAITTPVTSSPRARAFRSMIAAACVAFPPGAAQRSTTRSPGSGSKHAPTTMDGRFCG